MLFHPAQKLFYLLQLQHTLFDFRQITQVFIINESNIIFTLTCSKLKIKSRMVLYLYE